MPKIAQEEELRAALHSARYRTDYRLPCDLTTGIPEHIGAAAFIPDATGPDAEYIDAMLEALLHALRHGETFVLLCEDRTVWERCTAIITAALGPGGEALQ
jgi:hypothetical protein